MIGNATLKIKWAFSTRLKRSIRFNKSFNLLTITAPQQFSQIDDFVRQDLETYASLRIKRGKIDTDLRKRVRSYFSLFFEEKPVRRNYYEDDSNHSLQDYFNKLNQHYFKNKCQIMSLGWSHKTSKRLLGKWCDASRSIILSSFLNSAKVPTNVVEFILYHEMCHQMFPPITRKKGRSVHHREFKEQESRFENYVEIKKWFKDKGFII